ncbi:MAG TPA: T9SS type A sorting domain-containing protein [Bacteroidetes bacterium]|nr:T9SS type A sorting domain-containing protein [Bacteroidota bacterium]
MKRKKIFYSFILFLIQLTAIAVYSQEFSFPLYFEDATGNRDTLILGYDPNATDSIDPEFGEINIVDQPWKDQLDVRTGEVKYFGDWKNVAPLYESKIQIVDKTCNFGHQNNIVAWCNHFPLIIKWDTSLFKNNNCVTGSLLNTWQYFAWDVVYGRTAFLSPDFFAFESDSLIIDSIAEGITPSVYTDGEKTIIMMWFAFADTATVPPTGVVELADQDNFSIYPNPSENFLFIKMDSEKSGVITIKMFNSNGQLVVKLNKRYNANEAVSINTAHLKAGLYYVTLIHKNKLLMTKKWLKTKN